jgi:LPXTG-motif cell wall-anchored protein
MAEVRARLDELKPMKKGEILNLDTPVKRATVGGLGGILLLAALGLFLTRRREN